MKRNWYGSVGSVSEGTMREQDLIPSFLWEARHLRLTKDERKKVSAIARKLSNLPLPDGMSNSDTHNIDMEYARQTGGTCADCGMAPDACLKSPCPHYDAGDDSPYWRSEDASFDLEELFDILGNHSLPYFSFGSHPGDGAAYGWWLDESFPDDCFDGLKVSDTSEVPRGYTGEVLHVNDHGNCTLYTANRGRLHMVWAVV